MLAIVARYISKSYSDRRRLEKGKIVIYKDESQSDMKLLQPEKELQLESKQKHKAYPFLVCKVSGTLLSPERIEETGRLLSHVILRRPLAEELILLPSSYSANGRFPVKRIHIPYREARIDAYSRIFDESITPSIICVGAGYALDSILPSKHTEKDGIRTTPPETITQVCRTTILECHRLYDVLDPHIKPFAFAYHGYNYVIGRPIPGKGQTGRAERLFSFPDSSVSLISSTSRTPEGKILNTSSDEIAYLFARRLLEISYMRLTFLCSFSESVLNLLMKISTDTTNRELINKISLLENLVNQNAEVLIYVTE